VRQILCIKLVKYRDKYTEMHGQQNVSIFIVNCPRYNIDNCHMPLELNCKYNRKLNCNYPRGNCFCCVFGSRMFIVTFLQLSKPYLHSDRRYECRYFYCKTKKLFTQWNCSSLKLYVTLKIWILEVFIFAPCILKSTLFTHQQMHFLLTWITKIKLRDDGH